MREGAFYAGVDTHSDFHVLAVVDSSATVVETRRFPSDAASCASVARELAGRWGCAAAAVECCGSYGRGLVEALAGAGVRAMEVPASFRRLMAGKDKSDEADAAAAATFALASAGRPARGPKDSSGPAGQLACLAAARRGAVKEATACVNEARGLLVKAPDPLRSRFKGMPKKRLMEALRRLAPGKGPDRCERLALRSAARRWAACEKERASLEAEMAAIVSERYPSLLELPGVGAVCAAEVAAAAGDNPERFKSEAAFAKAVGCAPLEASSGKTVRHRLNRGGDRRANCAIHRIVVVRMSCDERTRAYVDKRVSQGKTKREAVRCLKRYVARELYRALLAPERRPPDLRLRARREALGETLAAAASAVGLSQGKVSRVERGESRDGRAEALLDGWLSSLEEKPSAREREGE